MTVSVEHAEVSRRYGVAGNSSEFSVSDLLARLDAARAAGCAPEILVDRQSQASVGGTQPFDPIREKLALYDQFRGFFRGLDRERVDAIILPSFLGHVFLAELQGEVQLPVFNLFEALGEHLERMHPTVRRIGVLTSDFLQRSGLFERFLATDRRRLVYADTLGSNADAMAADGGETLATACARLVAQGAEVIVLGSDGMAPMRAALHAEGFPVLDVNRIYAEFILAGPPVAVKKAFKIGVVGGVGPAATVDLLNKIVVNTDARRDQEHIKVVVEQNPQIPDRTENLLKDGIDPTVALYATCKRLQADDADIIVIPCNTAHAFVPRIQPYLSIPIVNMLDATMATLSQTWPGQKQVGLLATSGTISTRVYHEAARAVGIELLVPDDENQAQVMDAIYGPRGVKAGFTEGECLTQLLAAMTSLVARGAEILILGCTELPLLMPQNPAYPIAGKTVAIVDPTEILAKTCIRLARAHEAM